MELEFPAATTAADLIEYYRLLPNWQKVAITRFDNMTQAAY